MRYFSIDDLRPEEVQSIHARLRDMSLQSDMEGLYWLPVPADLLEPVQREHAAQCGPHVMALDVQENALQMELLVRARNRLRCECVRYATPELQQHMIAWVDQLLRDLGIAF